MLLTRKVNGAIRRARNLAMPKALILLYHRVADAEIDPHQLCVGTRNFAEQLAVLNRHHALLSLRQCAEAIQQGRLPRRVVVITFDDGYVDNLHNAKPMLERHGFPATLFVTTGQIGSPREFWWDELEKIFLLPGALPQELDMEIGGRSTHWDLNGTRQYTTEQFRADRSWQAGSGTPPNPRHELYQMIHTLFRALPSHQRTIKMDALLKWSGTSREARPSYRALTGEELATLARTKLIELGGHTVTHPNLAEQAAAVQREEINSGKTALEQMVGRPVESFSYPYGLYSESTVELVRQAGYRCACTCSERTARRESDLFQLPRLIVRNWNGEEFAKRLHACFRNE